MSGAASPDGAHRAADADGAAGEGGAPRGPPAPPAPARRLLRRGPVSSTWEIAAPAAPAGRVYEKRYDVLWPWTPLRFLLKGNLPCLSAGHEAANARAVAALGVGAPAVLTVEERWSWEPRRLGLRRAGALQLAAAPGERLDRLLAGARDGGGGAAEAARRERRRAASALACAVRALHAGGRAHRDLYLCHVYWEREAGRVTLIDLARCARRRALARRWRVKDLAALCYSSAGLATDGDRLAFLRGYLDAGADRTTLRAWAAAVARKARAIERRGAKG